jgi:hypothetical protein
MASQGRVTVGEQLSLAVPMFRPSHSFARGHTSTFSTETGRRSRRSWPRSRRGARAGRRALLCCTGRAGRQTGPTCSSQPLLLPSPHPSDAERQQGAIEAYTQDPVAPSRVLVNNSASPFQFAQVHGGDGWSDAAGALGCLGLGNAPVNAPVSSIDQNLTLTSLTPNKKTLLFPPPQVFEPFATNGQVFSSLVDLEPLLSGIHTTIFAYGVTGSGKTHTMLGDSGDADDGLMQRAIKSLFEMIAGHSDT